MTDGRFPKKRQRIWSGSSGIEGNERSAALKVLSGEDYELFIGEIRRARVGGKKRL